MSDYLCIAATFRIRVFTDGVTAANPNGHPHRCGSCRRSSPRTPMTSGTMETSIGP